jgi:DNA primase
MKMITGTTNIRDVLAALDVEVKRESNNEITGCCPVHEKRIGKPDRSPSWSINSNTGLWMCHSCGARGNLPQLIAEITGSYESVSSVYSLMINSGIKKLTEQSQTVGDKTAANWKLYMSFDKPPQEELEKRRLKASVADKYGIRWSTSSSAWIIPIVSRNGILMGWQEKHKNKVINQPRGVHKSETLFGIDRFSSRVAILVESPLDVVRFSSSFNGIQCLASYGVGISKTQLRLLEESCDALIVAYDNDAAGEAGGTVLMRHLPSFRHGVKWLKYSHTKAKDIGEMDDSELAIAVKQATALPWWIDGV